MAQHDLWNYVIEALGRVEAQDGGNLHSWEVWQSFQSTQRSDQTSKGLGGIRACWRKKEAFQGKEAAGWSTEVGMTTWHPLGSGAVKSVQAKVINKKSLHFGGAYSVLG